MYIKERHERKEKYTQPEVKGGRNIRSENTARREQRRPLSSERLNAGRPKVEADGARGSVAVAREGCHPTNEFIRGPSSTRTEIQTA